MYFLILSTVNVVYIHVDMEDDVEEKNLCMYIQVQVHIVHLQVYFGIPRTC